MNIDSKVTWSFYAMFRHIAQFFGGTLLCLGLITVLILAQRNGIRRSLRKLRTYPHKRRLRLRLTQGWAFCALFFPALSWAFLDRPILGLIGVFAVPFLYDPIVHQISLRRNRRGNRSALCFFSGLLGLVRAGISLPNAIFQMTKSPGNENFTLALNGHLRRYEEGKSLALCLARFRGKSEMKAAQNLVALLELAYQHGLPIVPILERRIPLLEAEEDLKERTRSIRNETIVQASFAILMPWGLGYLMVFFQPDLISRFVDSSLFLPIGALAVLLQAMGGICAWGVARFY